MVDFPVLPSQTALINVDLQNRFVESARDGLVVVDRINQLAWVCREAGILVIHARHILRPDGSHAGVLGEIVPELQDGGFLSPDSETAAFHERLALDARDILLEKPRFGAFTGTALEETLRNRGIDTVIITGIQTNICCDTTAREAFAREFHVFFVSDATATSDDEDEGISAAALQRATLYSLGIFAQIITLDEMITKIQMAARASSLAAQ